MSDFTPGPYIIAPPGGPQGPFFGLVNGQGNVVATQIVGEANTRLFQAAPELLEALRNLLSECETAWCVEEDEFGPNVEAARLAIAKAEGREP